MIYGRRVEKQYRSRGGPCARTEHVGTYRGRGWFMNLVVEACVVAKQLDDELRADPDKK